MRSEHALKAFKSMNCAQAILHAYADIHGITAAQIDEAKKLGGGRAEGGVCGAAAAAMTLADENGREALRTAFEEQAGDIRCREIRKAGRLDCGGCVALAAEVLDRAR